MVDNNQNPNYKAKFPVSQKILMVRKINHFMLTQAESAKSKD